MIFFFIMGLPRNNPFYSFFLHRSRIVGLSNMLDRVVTKDLDWRAPAEGTHRKFVAVSLVGSELPTKVVERVEGMLIVKAFLVLPVAAFHLAVMAGRVRPDQLVSDT